jgi:hypothetical protein
MVLEMIKKYKPLIYILLSLAWFVAGCNRPRSQLYEFNGLYRSSNYKWAIAFAESIINKGDKPKGNDLLWSLQAGAGYLQIGDCNSSVKYFDKSEEMLNYYDFESKTADTAASILVNDNAVPYLGEEYDGVMVNTYKAVNFMIMGKYDLARVEFNRALDRQRRAKEHFANEIVKLKEQVAKEQQAKADVDLNRNIDNPEIGKIVQEKYPNLFEYQAYPDFVNPFTTYFAGLSFNLMGDSQKAVDLLKESAGMVAENQYIKEDFAATENALDGKGKIENTVWVVFENGFGPTKEEVRFDLPLFVVSDKVNYFGIALPVLRPGQQAYSHLTINADGREYRTAVAADMERVIRTEFNKDFPGILTRAIVSATVKAAAQYAIEKNDRRREGMRLLSFAMTLYSAGTTAADVRIWSALPQDFQVARLPMPANRQLEIISPEGTKILNIKIDPCCNCVVYVKIPNRYAVPFCGIIKSQS